MKCSFCEYPLLCKACGQPFVARSAEAHVAMSQPDMEVYCPECQAVLACKACGYVYGESGEETESS
ncbi:MAG: hypothetical protein K2R98_01240 [Gemmataceae bacterium]|nr:hypothetical protein [Gemmataceae bacterium]